AHADRELPRLRIPVDVESLRVLSKHAALVVFHRAALVVAEGQYTFALQAVQLALKHAHLVGALLGFGSREGGHVHIVAPSANGWDPISFELTWQLHASITHCLVRSIARRAVHREGAPARRPVPR